MGYIYTEAKPHAFYLVHVHQGSNAKSSETLLDNYRITIDMKKECTRVLLGLASPLYIHPQHSISFPKLREAHHADPSIL